MNDWSREEVTAVIDDYLSMLEFEFSGIPYKKAAHLRRLQSLLKNRSRGSIEFKRANISAALIDSGFRYIDGYKPRFNYQALLADVLADRLLASRNLQTLAAFDADRPVVVPEVDDILAVFAPTPEPAKRTRAVREASRSIRLADYLERESRNRSLGDAGELFAINIERARLISLGEERLAGRVEHVSKTRGDGLGYDILSFEPSGVERLIEVKTTKYGEDTPFFVTRNEVAVSAQNSDIYRVYRLHSFPNKPRLYTLRGSIEASCQLTSQSFLARPK